MENKRKIIPKSKLVNNDSIDSLKERSGQDPMRFNYDILFWAKRCWDSLSEFRQNRERCKRYTYGDQWGDKIEYDGKTMTESEYILCQGNVPLANNLIRRLVRTVMGAYRSQSKEPTCMARDRMEQHLSEVMSTVLQYNWQLNRMGEINGRTFEEFLISGSAFQKETYGWRNDKMDCWTDIVSPNYMFFDGSMQDPRHWDLNLIGQIHDIPFDELCSQFAKKPDDFEFLSQIYSLAKNRQYVQTYSNKLIGRRIGNIDFMNPYDTNLCRVIEVWCKERKQRLRCHDYLNGDYYKDEVGNKKNIDIENESRITEGMAAGIPREDIPLIEYEWFIDSYWYYRFMTPFGHILTEGESPFMHKGHPYTIKLYPYIDGEVHSFVNDVIDQQRYINRMITLTDWVIRASAKGVLMFPKSLIPDDMTPEDIAKQWTEFNGMIFYEPKAGVQMPQQISNNSTNVGMKDLLQMQIGLMEEVSGVHGAIQGKQGYSGISAALYSMQSQNATTSLLDLLETFSGFVIDGAYKKVKNIQQFYDPKRIENIAGNDAKKVLKYDPEKVLDVEFDMAITESASSPTYRMIANDFLMEIWRTGQISIEMLLEHGNFPFADQLLLELRSQKEQLEKGEMPQGLSPEMLQQVGVQPAPASAEAA